MMNVYTGTIVKKDDLYHHGVKGQKWGIRRYQNDDGSLTAEGRSRYQKTLNKMAKKEYEKGREDLTKKRIIPKGTKMYRTSANKDEKLNGSTYVTYTDVDRNHYKSGWIRYTANSKHAYEYNFTLNKDLTLPSREHQEEVVSKVVKSNKKYLHETVKSYFDILMPENSLNRIMVQTKYPGGISKYIDNMKSTWSKKTPEELAFSVCQSLGKATNVKNQIINELKKEGYTAMVDEASVGGRNNWNKEGYDPLIIFDASDMSKNGVKKISRRTEQKALSADQRWRNKINRTTAKWSAI